MEPVKADVYTEVNSECKQRIITGHGIPAILVEVNQGGGFNNRAEEMKAAILQFQKTTILGYQQKISRVFNSILKYVTKEDVKLEIIPFLSEEMEARHTTDTTDENADKEGETTNIEKPNS